MSARSVTNQEILAALSGSKSVSAWAKAVGCSRALIYARARECSEVGAALERLKADRPGTSRRSELRRRKKARQAYVDGSPEAQALAEELRELALKTLRKIAGGEAYKGSDRVSAAKELLRYAESTRGRVRPADSSPKPEGQARETPPPIKLEEARAQVLGLSRD